jgi:ribonuclease T2
MRARGIALSAVLAFGFVARSYAIEPLVGELVAKTPCSAVQSIKTGANPGHIRLRVNESYPVFGLNKPGGAYVQIKVAGARPELRWVERSCGSLSTEAESGRPEAHKYVLAISWQPAFCEIKPEKTECRTQVPGRFDADHFTLHGLWPQPETNVFCGVSAADKRNANRGHWDALPEPDIRPQTRARLKEAMPGTASHLERHEFTKHGSCFPGNADTYFRVSLSLLDQINRSKLRDLMAEHIGGTVSSDEMKRALERTFGAGAGAALGIHCIGDVDSHRTLINELHINLKGPLAEATKLQDVLDTSARAQSDCSRGVVDAVGLD